jgi:hypothetical protein
MFWQYSRFQNVIIVAFKRISYTLYCHFILFVIFQSEEIIDTNVTQMCRIMKAAGF